VRHWVRGALVLSLAGCDVPAERSGGPASLVDAGPGDDVSAPPAAPLVSVSAPPDGSPLVAGLVTLLGEAGEGTTRVDLSVDGGASVRASGTTTWRATVALGVGSHSVLVVATAPGGRAEWLHTLHVGPEVTLRAPTRAGPEVALRLDRFALERLLPRERQDELVLTWLDLRPLVENALAALAAPEDWGIDVGAWGPAEHNLARLLGMTPGTLDPSGSALAPLLALSERLGLHPAHILADLLDQAPTAAVLSAEDVAPVLLDGLMRSHPRWRGDDQGRLAVTLADALADLKTLSERYGPAGGHPGFVAAPPSADLLQPNFALLLQADSNVTVRPGLAPGLGYASHVTAPEGEPLLALDFEDPDRLRIEGLVPEPTVTLALTIVEANDAFPLVPAEPEAAPPRGPSAVWDAAPWELERVVAQAAYAAFAGRFPRPRTLSYDLGAISPAAVLQWDAGLLRVDVAADLGPPPPTAWIWDLILDVAQARLHDGGLGEGEASATLSLPDIPIGLTAEELVARMRPALQEQAAEIAAWMLGQASDLESRATVWLDAVEPRLVVVPGAPSLYDDETLSGRGTAELALGGQGRTVWTRGPEGTRAALLVGPWEGDRVRVGVVEVPE